MFYAARCLSSIIYNKNWKPKGHNIGERLNKVLPFRMTCYSTFRIIISYIMKMVNKHILRLREKLEIIRFSLSISVFCTSAVNASSHPFHLARETPVVGNLLSQLALEKPREETLSAEWSKEKRAGSHKIDEEKLY